jgi:hypothetical protein
LFTRVPRFLAIVGVGLGGAVVVLVLAVVFCWLGFRAIPLRWFGGWGASFLCGLVVGMVLDWGL